jgi:hypothetical protein
MKQLIAAILLCCASASHGRFQQSPRQRNLYYETEEDLANIGISGWWTECNTEDSRLPSCQGNLIPIEPPLTFDTTGQTCYINPYDNGKKVVFWFALLIQKLPNNETYVSDSVYVYKLFNRRSFDIDCNTDGLCSCDGIEDVRKGWNNDTFDTFDTSDDGDVFHQIIILSIPSEEDFDCIARGWSGGTYGDTDESLFSCAPFNAAVSYRQPPTMAPTDSGVSGLLMEASSVKTLLFGLLLLLAQSL